MTALAAPPVRVGDVFGKLTVEGQTTQDRWRCRCACGACNTYAARFLVAGVRTACVNCAPRAARAIANKRDALLVEPLVEPAPVPTLDLNLGVVEARPGERCVLCGEPAWRVVLGRDGHGCIVDDWRLTPVCRRCAPTCGTPHPKAPLLPVGPTPWYEHDLVP